MMRLHFIRITLICLLIIFLIFIPFLPGAYDNLAVMISSELQYVSFVCLLLVPIGILWLIYELFRRKINGKGASKSVYFAKAALLVLSISAIVAAIVAFGGIGSFRGSAIFGISLLIGYIYTVFSIIIPRLRKMKYADDLMVNPIIFYLIIIPLVVVIFRTAFIIPATEYSRTRAIEQSETIIQDLEVYYAKNGRYPVSLQGLWKDYDTDVIGIEKYYYEPNGNAYNLFFEQFTYDLFAREIVMYNKLDEHIIRSHPSFIFSLNHEDFARYRGYFSEKNLPQQHWKYFWFD